MAFDVSALQNYTEENVAVLITSSVFNAKTQQLVAASGNIMTGIKSAETINRMETDAIFQSDASCGFTPSGTTAITQRTLTVGKLKVNEQLCPKDLETKYTQKALAIGSEYQNIPFEEEYTTKKSDLIAAQNEVALWQGDTTSGNGNLSRFDGYIKLIDAASGSVIHANQAAYVSGGPVASGTPLVGDVALAVADAIYAAVPAAIVDKEDFRIFCGWDFFKAYVLALKYKNLYHYSADNEAGEIDIPGTNYRLVAVHGLDGTNRLFGLRLSNMWIGTDMENEEEQFKMWYSEDDDVVKFKARWKLGTQIGIPSEIVEFHRGA
ncbi:hypothetical protein [Chitinophaga sp. sic0106]|uniref:hypothetical protein n=1 Tax=Chitinophaga sp. sic0106 TaxID=2854785 RepID=UPI001C4877E6|nr:hypothetical protein [Chitinophaga sp. sic0106]MBV7534049.1 hypothetical protein [Chitinophaga sp. sic0106]